MTFDEMLQTIDADEYYPFVADSNPSLETTLQVLAHTLLETPLNSLGVGDLLFDRFDVWSADPEKVGTVLDFLVDAKKFPHQHAWRDAAVAALAAALPIPGVSDPYFKLRNAFVEVLTSSGEYTRAEIEYILRGL